MLTVLTPKPKGLADLANYAALVDEGVCLLKDGGFLAAWMYTGPDLESASHDELAVLSSQVNAALVRLGNGWMLHVDAIECLDGTRCLLEWKTTASRYPEEPAGLLALDPQLVCYSWVTGIADVAQVVFVRKRLVEIQYFRTTISDEQREEFSHLVLDSIRRIEAAEFLPHSGIRFPQNPCTSCPYIGLCLGRQDLAEARLVRRPGAEDLGLFDELAY